MVSPDLKFSDRDEYGRKNIASKIKLLLKSDIPISPMIIDGKWGQGKTEFCYKLINHLKEADVKCVYIDAYRNDHINDPLLTIFSSIVANITDSVTKDTLVSRAVPVLSFGLKVLGKAAIAWGLKQDTDIIASDFKSAIQKSGDAIFDAAAEKLITDHQKEEANLEALQIALTAATEDEKLTVFIDELDRCRPSYAVDVIEKVKHVFDTPNITFVLVTNSDQLKAAITHTYGDDIDAEDYINKFISFTIRLNQFNGEQYNRKLNSIKHFQTLLGQIDELSFMHGEHTSVNKYIVQLISANNLSLRQVEKLVTRIRVIEKTIGEPFSQIKLTRILVLMSVVFLDCFSPENVYEIERGKIHGVNILKSLNININRSTEITLGDELKYVICLHNLLTAGPDFDLDNDTDLRDAYQRFSDDILQSGTFKESMEYLYIDCLKAVRFFSS